jgi:hypothetical protein
MAEINRWSKAELIQTETARISGLQDWKERIWWREFLVSLDCVCLSHRLLIVTQSVRRAILSKIEIPDEVNEMERKKIERIIEARISASKDWWGGPWIKEPGFSEWHLNQHLRSIEHLKQKKKKMPQRMY